MKVKETVVEGGGLKNKSFFATPGSLRMLAKRPSAEIVGQVEGSSFCLYQLLWLGGFCLIAVVCPDVYFASSCPEAGLYGINKQSKE